MMGQFSSVPPVPSRTIRNQNVALAIWTTCAILLQSALTPHVTQGERGGWAGRAIRLALTLPVAAYALPGACTPALGPCLAALHAWRALYPPNWA